MIPLNLFAQRELLHAQTQLFGSLGNRRVSFLRFDPATRLHRWAASISRAYHLFPSLLREFSTALACF
jgi:hypothetical protein